MDPAIEKWFHMRESTHHSFKFDRRVSIITGLLMFGVPGFVYWGAQKWNVSFWMKRVF